MRNILAVGDTGRKVAWFFLLIGASRCAAGTADTVGSQNMFFANHLDSIGFDGGSSSGSNNAETIAETAEQLDSLPRMLSEGYAVPEEMLIPGAYGTSSVLPMTEAASSNDAIPTGDSYTQGNSYPGVAQDPFAAVSIYDQAGGVPAANQPTTDSAYSTQPFQDAAAGVGQGPNLESGTRQPTADAPGGTATANEMPPSSGQVDNEPVKGGHIAGIVVGVAAAAAAAGLVFVWHKRRQARRVDYIGRYQRYGDIELH